MARLTRTNVKKAIEGCLGNYSDVARKLGVHRSAITLFFKKHPDLKKMADQDRERLLDVAENQIAVAINGGDLKVCMWFADNHGKERGYGRKLEMNANLKQDVSFKERLKQEIKTIDAIPLEVKKQLVKNIAKKETNDKGRTKRG